VTLSFADPGDTNLSDTHELALPRDWFPHGPPRPWLKGSNVRGRGAFHHPHNAFVVWWIITVGNGSRIRDSRPTRHIIGNFGTNRKWEGPMWSCVSWRWPHPHARSFHIVTTQISKQIPVKPYHRRVWVQRSFVCVYERRTRKRFVLLPPNEHARRRT